MKVTLTGINFNYENGFNSDYTSVNLTFNTTGATFNLVGYVVVDKDQYTNASGNTEQLKSLIIQEVLNKIQETQAE